MKKLVLFLVLLTGAFTQDSLACLCGFPSADEREWQKNIKEIRDSYRYSFKGAIFTGKVLSAEKVKREEFSEIKLEIQVEKHWLGVKEPRLTIFTGIGGGDCGVKFNVGEVYVFRPQYWLQRLWTDICDYPEAESKNADGDLVRMFDEVLGKAKRFKTKVKK